MVSIGGQTPTQVPVSDVLEFSAHQVSVLPSGHTIEKGGGGTIMPQMKVFMCPLCIIKNLRS